jgi:hypothetical protein
MSEWQPARLRFTHRYDEESITDFIGMDKLQKLTRKVVRVRPYPARLVSPSDLRELNCDASKFFEVHPDDLGPEIEGKWICEHEILTD